LRVRKKLIIFFHIIRVVYPVNTRRITFTCLSFESPCHRLSAPCIIRPVITRRIRPVIPRSRGLSPIFGAISIRCQCYRRFIRLNQVEILARAAVYGGYVVFLVTARAVPAVEPVPGIRFIPLIRVLSGIRRV